MSAALLVLAATSSLSGTTIFNEGVSGDVWGNQTSPQAVGTFVAGLNEFYGHTSLSTDTAGGGQGDSMLVTLLPSQTITSIVLTISNFSGTATGIVNVLQTSPSIVSIERYKDLSGNQVITFVNLPVSGQPAVILSSQLQTSGSSNADGWDWKWEVTVVQTPETSSIYLLGAGLAALGLWSQRRRLTQ